MELGLLYASGWRALFQELFHETKDRGIERAVDVLPENPKRLVRMDDEFAVVENRVNSVGFVSDRND